MAGKRAYHEERPATRAERVQRWRDTHPEEARSRVAASSKKATQRKQRIVERLKSFKGCHDCGEGDVVVLDLHHVEPKNERLRQHKVSFCDLSWSDFRAEVRKCVVVCANCHRRRHSG